RQSTSPIRMSIDVPPVHGARRVVIGFPPRRRGPSARWLASVSAAVCLILLAVEIASGWHVLHSTEFFTALAARKYVWANTLAAALIGAFAIAAPGRWRWLAVVGPGLYLLAILIAT